MTLIDRGFCTGLATLVLRGCDAQAQDVVNFEISGALVNLTKVGGAGWDGMVSPSDAESAASLAALAGTQGAAYGVVFEEANGLLVAGTGAPDVQGRVEVLVSGGVAQSFPLPAVDNTFHPVWSGYLIEGLALRPEVSVRVKLGDTDLTNVDPIGVFLIPSSAFADAAIRGTVVWLPVAEQTQGQVLFVGISAWPALAAPPDTAAASLGDEPVSMRDRYAEVVAMPEFQEWARANGLKVGTVTPIEPGTEKKYMQGAVTPVGLYVSGPDDERAVSIASRQLNNEPEAPWQHRRTDTRPKYGTLEVKEPDYPPGTLADRNGQIFTPEAANAQIRRHLEVSLMGHPGGLAAQGDDPQQRDALLDAAMADPAMVAGAMADLGLQEAKAPTLKLEGKWLAPRYGDPSGSVRFRTTDGTDHMIPADQVVREHVRWGGEAR